MATAKERNGKEPKTETVNPQDLLRGRLISATLSGHSKPDSSVKVVLVRDSSGFARQVLHTGFRSALSAINRKLSLQARDVTREVLGEAEPEQTALTPIQYITEMTRLNRDHSRITAHVLDMWPMVVSDNVAADSSALATLFYIRDFQDKNPDEIRTILNDPTHPDYPGGLLSDQEEVEMQSIAEGAAFIAQAAALSGISYSEMTRLGLGMVYKMWEQNDTFDQLEGLVNIPEVNEKFDYLASQPNSVQTIRKIKEDLKLRIVLSIPSIVRTDNPEGIETLYRLLFDDPLLTLPSIIKSLEVLRKGEVSTYDEVLIAVNMEYLLSRYRIVSGKEDISPQAEASLKDVARRFEPGSWQENFAEIEKGLKDIIKNEASERERLTATEQDEVNQLLEQIRQANASADLETLRELTQKLIDLVGSFPTRLAPAMTLPVVSEIPQETVVPPRKRAKKSAATIVPPSVPVVVPPEEVVDASPPVAKVPDRPVVIRRKDVIVQISKDDFIENIWTSLGTSLSNQVRDHINARTRLDMGLDYTDFMERVNAEYLKRVNNIISRGNLHPTNNIVKYLSGFAFLDAFSNFDYRKSPSDRQKNIKNEIIKEMKNQLSTFAISNSVSKEAISVVELIFALKPEKRTEFFGTVQWDFSNLSPALEWLHQAVSEQQESPVAERVEVSEFLSDRAKRYAQILDDIRLYDIISPEISEGVRRSRLLNVLNPPEDPPLQEELHELIKIFFNELYKGNSQRKAGCIALLEPVILCLNGETSNLREMYFEALSGLMPDLPAETIIAFLLAGEKIFTIIPSSASGIENTLYDLFNSMQQHPDTETITPVFQRLSKVLPGWWQL